MQLRIPDLIIVEQMLIEQMLIEQMLIIMSVSNSGLNLQEWPRPLPSATSCSAGVPVGRRQGQPQVPTSPPLDLLQFKEGNVSP